VAYQLIEYEGKLMLLSLLKGVDHIGKLLMQLVDLGHVQQQPSFQCRDKGCVGLARPPKWRKALLLISR
jgi:hypothetical protein